MNAVSPPVPAPPIAVELGTEQVNASVPERHQTQWTLSIPFLIMHLLPLGIIWTGMRLSDAVLCVALYYGRMFFITAGYHRYFAHRSYKLGRFMQFVMAFGGATAAQKGVLWWAGHHRHHHKYSDMPEDVHSPKQGFWWSHVGWILCMKFHHTPYDQIKDFAKYPELRWLNRYHLVPPTLLGLSVWYFGGWPALFGGFFLSTVLLYHGTFSINSLTHMWGKRRYKTTDDSRNSLILALITMGEGWHNNHHYYQSTANQGFYWWEIDLSYYILKMMSWVGLARDLRNPSEAVLNRNRLDRPEQLAPSGQSEEPPGGPSGEELAA
jgi:stearoyl-CoA desaturase (delta-9 desaturase)